jgi:hypothetical protein
MVEMVLLHQLLGQVLHVVVAEAAVPVVLPDTHQEQVALVVEVMVNIFQVVVLPVAQILEAEVVVLAQLLLLMPEVLELSF